MTNNDSSDEGTARPKIPAEIAREILIESGHRCAVCGESCSLEKAHIIPWCKTHEHRLENLICLCANCHTRADQEEWGAKTLHEYKRKPWILRRGTDLPLQQPAKRVQLTLAVEFTTFDERLERLLVIALAGLLEISPDAIKICSVEKGSVKLVVELPLDAAERLVKAGESGAIALEDYLDSLGEIVVSGTLNDSDEFETLGSAEQLADLKAKAWCQYATALRISGKLREADDTFTEAQQFLQDGTGDPPLRADLLMAKSALRIAQRRLAEAIDLADEARCIYSDTGHDLLVPNAIVRKAIAQVYAGETQDAVLTLNQAIPLIDRERNPELLRAACHNLIRCYIDLEQPEQALSLFSEIRGLYRGSSDPLIALQAAWQEGQLLRDLGHLHAAKEALLRVRKGFIEHSMLYEAATITLDLAAVFFKLNDRKGMREMVEAAVPMFRALGVDPEVRASLDQLAQLAKSENNQAFELIRLLSTKLEKTIDRKRR